MKAALVGYGYWGKILRGYIDQSEHFSLTRICTAHASERNDALFTTELSDILDDPETEAAFVCTPTDTHFALCRELLSAGRHVFCEKPAVRTMDQFRILSDLARRNGAVFFTDYTYLASESIRMMKRMIKEIGRVCAFDGEISQFGSFYRNETAFETVGVHLLSVLAFLFPDMEIRELRSRMWEGTGNYGGEAELILKDNVTASIRCSLLSPEKRRTISVYGTEGSMRFDMLDPDATLRCCRYEKRDHGFVKTGEQSWLFDEANNLSGTLGLFFEAIRGKDNDGNLAVSEKVCRILDEIAYCSRSVQ